MVPPLFLVDLLHKCAVIGRLCKRSAVLERRQTSRIVDVACNFHYARSQALKSQLANNSRSSVRFVILNFINVLSKRSLTVSGEMFKRAPISRLVYPKHTNAVTSFSRTERVSHFVQSLSLDVYWFRPAFKSSGINSDSGRPSSEASVESVT